MIRSSSNKAFDVFIALLPVVVLIILLSFNVSQVFGDDALDGSNQMILLLCGALATALGMIKGVPFEEFIRTFSRNIGDTTKALIILLLIGALAGTWMISGIVPAMIYYGLQVLNPKFFLVASVIICSLVSLSTGSSWSTSATVGIALMGMGKMMGIHEGMVAGAILSGAYFGDKMSPLSDTTNLAPVMAGTDLFTHIRYMMLTTVPSILIAIGIFFVLGWQTTPEVEILDISHMLHAIEDVFYISPILFLAPFVVIILIVRRVDALIAILAGVLTGALFAVVLQPDIVQAAATHATSGALGMYEGVMQAMVGEVSINSADPLLRDLLTTGGMQGMLGTIWLILSAMIFGGAMEAAGFLNTLTKAITKLAKSAASLIASTLGTSIFLNITASDQYLAIVVPGRMFKDLYRERNLAPENLSRSLEDAGTVTSVLVPWNTCGAYHSGVLGVATGSYAFYAFFNLLSPLVSLIYALFSIKIRRIDPLQK
jgi:Na+:H+ antiporter, NhaC family